VEQKEAVCYLTGDERIRAVVGLAGAGKSTLLAAARRAWEADRYCNGNIEMTPLRKVRMALSCCWGLQENGADDGGVDERQGVFAAGCPA
jgi:ATP-dependent exoDNAse (exonuclease V) alpha subunit